MCEWKEGCCVSPSASGFNLIADLLCLASFDRVGLPRGDDADDTFSTPAPVLVGVWCQPPALCRIGRAGAQVGLWNPDSERITRFHAVSENLPIARDDPA